MTAKEYIKAQCLKAEQAYYDAVDRETKKKEQWNDLKYRILVAEEEYNDAVEEKNKLEEEYNKLFDIYHNELKGE